MNAASPWAYVELAIAAMKLATTKDDLFEWWRGEFDNRRKWRLSTDQDPGRKLMEAFEAKRSEMMEKETQC